LAGLETVTVAKAGTAHSEIAETSCRKGKNLKGKNLKGKNLGSLIYAPGD
jgi:hypothetical protein